jgi:hypothetical protein
VIGTLERDGELRAEHVQDTKAKTIFGCVEGRLTYKELIA